MSVRQVCAATLAVAMALIGTLCARGLGAQGAGAAFLLLPVGARSVGAGAAAVADTLGPDGAWWNPAALGAMKRPELSLSGAQTFEGTSAALSIARPSRVFGTIGLAGTVLDYGSQAVTDDVTGGEVGTLTIRSSIAMLTYATPVGDRLRLGLSYKYARLAFTCSGVCGNTPQIVGSGSAVDVGAQYVLPTPLPVTVAAAVRHIGPSFQVLDAEQADPLPRTWQIGASARIPVAALDSADTSIDVMADLLGSVAYESLSARLGMLLTYRSRYSLRGGYTLVEGEGGGPAIGLGAFLSDGMVLDIARRFDRFSSQAGQSPTYVSLRFLF